MSAPTGSAVPTSAGAPTGTTATTGDGTPTLRARMGDLLAYSSGSLGMGVWVTVPGLLLLYFMTHVLGVTPLLAGLTLLLPKILDAVVHPLLGTISDRHARRSGHRRGLLWWGLLLAVAMTAMFSVPAGLTGGGAALWIAGWYIAGNMLFACFQVPYLTTPSDLKIGYHERTRVFMFRLLLLTIGLLGAGVAAPALVVSGARGDYSQMALILSGVMVVTGFVGIMGVRRLTEHSGFRAPDDREHTFLGDLKIAWRDRNFRLLVLSYLFTGTTTHLFLAAVPFYTQYVFGAPGLTSLFMGAFLAPAVVAGPMWLAVSRRLGKQRGLLLSQLIFIVGSLALAAGGTLGVAVTTAVIVLLGTSFAGLQLFAFSMLPDAVAVAERGGSSRAGAYTGVWTATEATGTAIGPYLYSAVLAIGGFVSTTAGHEVVQSAVAQTALVVGITVVPAVLMVVAIAVQARCRLDRATAS